ncbi:hypothetical protein CQ046_05245 [Chryseobacterium sp. MYb7]|nr:hypothetical protein CQ046_05245 [Chryseobacterium sp. MYb7]
MMNISIDSSILRRDRTLSSSDILLLAKMSKLGLLKFHISWIVYKEITTTNYLESKEIINKVIKELNNINKKGVDDIDFFKFKKIAREIEAIDIEKSTQKHWKNFIKDSKIILHTIDEKHGENVMNSYFEGTEPFPTPKSRKDIPDAFIYQALKTMSKTFGQIHFICDDNNLRESCDNLPNIIGIKEFSELYDLPEFKLINDKYKSIEHYADELLIIEDNIQEIKVIANDDIWNNILNDIIIFSTNIPDDNNEGRLVGIDEVSNIEIDSSKIQYIDNYFYIPIKAEGLFTIEYFIYKSDYYIFDERRNIQITDWDWNDHYFLVEEDFDVKFSFKYKIAKDKVDLLEFETEKIDFEEVNIIPKK